MYNIIIPFAVVSLLLCVCITDKDTLTEGQSKRLWQVKKKVYFFTVWSRENSITVSLLAKVVAIEHATAVREMEERAEAEREVGRERVRPRGTGTSGGSAAPSEVKMKLIEELNWRKPPLIT